MEKENNHPQDTETRILKAAEREFLEKGYDGARTTSIAVAAGVTHAMLHYYFRTKDKLFERIVSEKMNLLGDIVLKAFGDGNLPLKERIMQGVETHFDFIAANRDLPRFVINEVYSHPERTVTIKEILPGIAKKLLVGLQHDIDECAGQGLCRRVDARMLVLDIVSLNLFPFIAAPIVGNIVADYDAFLEARKRENVETILGKLEIR